MSGRPRTPTKVLEMRGAFVKHPERRAAREGEPEVTKGLGKPPARLNEAQVARWRDISKMCYWLNYSHRGIVEQTARLWALECDNAATAPQQKLLQQNWKTLGATPVDSSKVKVPDRPADGDAQQQRFFGKKKA